MDQRDGALRFSDVLGYADGLGVYTQAKGVTKVETLAV
jgi:hypothetical protein